MRTKRILQILLVSVITILFFSCTKTIYVPITNSTQVNIKDSIIFHDSTIYHIIERESLAVIKPSRDTSYLRTNLAHSTAFVDNGGKLHHTLANNSTDSLKTVIKWKEKIISRDSIVTRDKPYPVEVVKTKYPKTYWYLLAFFILFIGIKIYKLGRKKII